MWKISLGLFALFLFALAWTVSERFQNGVKRLWKRPVPPKSQLEQFQEEVLRAKDYYKSHDVEASLEELQQLVKGLHEIRIEKSKSNQESIKTGIELFLFCAKVVVAILVIIATWKSQRIWELLEQALLLWFEK